MGRGLYPHGRAPAPCGKGGEQFGRSTAPPGKAFVQSGKAVKRLGTGAYPSGKDFSPTGDSFAKPFVFLEDAEISALLPLSAYLPQRLLPRRLELIPRVPGGELRGVGDREAGVEADLGVLDHAVVGPLGVELVAWLMYSMYSGWLALRRRLRYPIAG
jgi:hypothetical protein